MIFLQGADMGVVETATKLFGPMGAICGALVVALVYVFRKYEKEKDARVRDAREMARALEEIAPHLARLARRVNRISREPEDSEPPPPASRVRVSDKGVDDGR